MGGNKVYFGNTSGKQTSAGYATVGVRKTEQSWDEVSGDMVGW